MSNIIVAVYTHAYGNEVRAFSKMESVTAWKDSIALDYWDDNFEEEKPSTSIGDAYFELMSDFFGFNECFDVVENIKIE